MTPTEIISDLDAAVRDWGQDITIRRLTLGPSGVQIPFGVDCRAAVRGYTPQQLVGDIRQGDRMVILSPTEMVARQWTWPPREKDQVVISDKVHNVEAANSITVGGELVRIEMRIRG